MRKIAVTVAMIVMTTFLLVLITNQDNKYTCVNIEDRINGHLT